MEDFALEELFWRLIMEKRKEMKKNERLSHIDSYNRGKRSGMYGLI